MVGNWALEVRMLKDTSSFWRSTPKGRKTTAFTSEKMVVFAPMPRASVTTAAAVNPGLERSRRKAQVRLWRNISVRKGTFVAAEKLIFSIRSLASTARLWDEPAQVRSFDAPTWSPKKCATDSHGTSPQAPNPQ